jgi:hypothetical protein
VICELDLWTFLGILDLYIIKLTDYQFDLFEGLLLVLFCPFNANDCLTAIQPEMKASRSSSPPGLFERGSSREPRRIRPAPDQKFGGDVLFDRSTTKRRSTDLHGSRRARFNHHGSHSVEFKHQSQIAYGSNVKNTALAGHISRNL